MRATRRLVAIRRSVPGPARTAYDSLWTRVRAEATSRGAHAWRFASVENPALFLEFLEFPCDSDPRSAPPLARALSELEAAHAGQADEWEES